MTTSAKEKRGTVLGVLREWDPSKPHNGQGRIHFDGGAGTVGVNGSEYRGFASVVTVEGNPGVVFRPGTTAESRGWWFQREDEALRAHWAADWAESLGLDSYD